MYNSLSRSHREVTSIQGFPNRVRYSVQYGQSHGYFATEAVSSETSVINDAP
jgi:hypothetical protein